MDRPGPIRTSSSKTGRLGELLVEAELSKFAVCNALANDFGLDLLCNIVVDDVVGFPFFVQVKTIRRLRSNRLTVQLSSTARGWNQFPCPVFLVVCVLEPSPLFLWRDGIGELEKLDQRTLRLSYHSSELAEATVLGNMAEHVLHYVQSKRDEEKQRKLGIKILNAQKARLITALSDISKNWESIVALLSTSPWLMHEIPAAAWEEIVVHAFAKSGFDDVTLTPRSQDGGRDIVAIKGGVGRVKIIGSIKTYKPPHTVRHDDVRGLLGELMRDQSASKAILISTGDFAPRIADDPFIRPFLPFRLELIDGESLLAWLAALLLANKKR